MKIFNKIREVGIAYFFRGCFRRLYYAQLQKKYGFDMWHISPIWHRKYVIEVIRYINKNKPLNSVAEIGCGLGDLLRNVNADNRIGMDIDENVIEAAKKLNRRNDEIEFCVGSFKELQGKKINYLITLNFMHGSRETEWIQPYTTVINNNSIDNIIVDVVPEGVDKACCLDFSKILPSSYTLKDRLGPYLGGRYVEIWCKQR